MADSTLNRFLSSGTTAERTAFTPDPPTAASGPDFGYQWFDTDDGLTYAWDGSAWVAPAGSGNVNAAGSLTNNALVIGQGSTDVATTTTGAGVLTFLGTPSSANLRSALTDETGTGAAVFATSPTLVTPVLGTPSSGTLTNCTGLPIAGGGTGQTTATAAFDALAPTTTQGDTIYHNGTDNVRLAKGTAGQVLTMNAGATAPEWAAASGGGGGMLAFTRYAPATNVTMSTTSTTLADLDAVNLAVTFTVPASGNVLVRLTAYADVNANQYFWAMREGGTLVAGTGGGAIRDPNGAPHTAAFVVTGLTPAASKTWTWAHGVTGGSTGRTFAGPGPTNPVSATNNSMNALIEVWSAP